MLMEQLGLTPGARQESPELSTLSGPLAPLAELVDEIWHQAGDFSTDFSWYTKRALLAWVYASCELYLTQLNANPSNAATAADQNEAVAAFLDRRMQQVFSFGNSVRSAQTTFDTLLQTGISLGYLLLNVTGTKPRRYA